MNVKKKCRKLLSLLMAACMVLGSLYLTGGEKEVKASTVETIDITVLTANTDNNEGWIWNNDSQILTLYGVDAGTIKVPAGATVDLIGYNKAESIKSDGDITFTGSGVLDVGSIFTQAGTLNFTGGYIKVTSSEDSPIYSANGINVTGGYINIDNSSSNNDYTIYTQGAYTQSGGYVAAKCYYGGIFATSADVSGGFLDINGGDWGTSCAVTNNGGVIKFENNKWAVGSDLNCSPSSRQLKK
ncbi:MAG: hypothetical protein ACI4D4_02510 [Lachnospira sp.]